jgi:hypothetical protein
MSDNIRATVRADLAQPTIGTGPLFTAEVMRHIFTQLDQADAALNVFMTSNAALTTEVLRLRADLTALRQRHAEAVEAAYAEGVLIAAGSSLQLAHGLEFWPKSHAKAALEEMP